MLGMLGGLMNNVLSGVCSTSLNTVMRVNPAATAGHLNNSIQVLGAWTQVRHKKSYKQSWRNPWTGQERFKGKKVQEWWDWDGLGPYKFRHHHYPNNLTLRDVQRRRIFKKHHFHRSKLQDIYYNDILPQEIRDKAMQEIYNMPFDSSIIRVNDRCSVTGRARGNFLDFRVSRFIFRNEADHNRVSGCQRAFWLYNTHIKP